VEVGANVNAGVFRVGGLWTGTLGGTCTAAYVAANQGHAFVLEVLLTATPPADPNKGDKSFKKSTPCHTAVLNHHPTAVTVLLAHGGDPNAVDTNGETPCMWGARFGSTACLHALADGAAQQDVVLDVNAVGTGGNWTGKTALDIALEYNRHEATAYLRDELGALRAEDLPQPKRPKSAAKTWKRPPRRGTAGGDSAGGGSAGGGSVGGGSAGGGSKGGSSSSTGPVDPQWYFKSGQIRDPGGDEANDEDAADATRHHDLVIEAPTHEDGHSKDIVVITGHLPHKHQKGISHFEMMNAARKVFETLNAKIYSRGARYKMSDLPFIFGGDFNIELPRRRQDLQYLIDGPQYLIDGPLWPKEGQDIGDEDKGGDSTPRPSAANTSRYLDPPERGGERNRRVDMFVCNTKHVEMHIEKGTGTPEDPGDGPGYPWPVKGLVRHQGSDHLAIFTTEDIGKKRINVMSYNVLGHFTTNYMKYLHKGTFLESKEQYMARCKKAWAQILDEQADVILLQECSYGFLMSFIMLAQKRGHNYQFMASFGTKLSDIKDGPVKILREPLGVAIVWKEERFKEQTPPVQRQALDGFYSSWVQEQWSHNMLKTFPSGALSTRDPNEEMWAWGAWAMADELTCNCKKEKKAKDSKGCNHANAIDASTLGGLVSGLCMEGEIVVEGGVDYMAAVSTQVGDAESMKRLLAITLSFA